MHPNIMKIIPLLRCNNLKESVAFYTNVLDFIPKYPEDANNEWVVELMNGELFHFILEKKDDGYVEFFDFFEFFKFFYFFEFFDFQRF